MRLLRFMIKLRKIIVKILRKIDSRIEESLKGWYPANFDGF